MFDKRNTYRIAWILALLLTQMAVEPRTLLAWSPSDLLPTSHASSAVGTRAWWKKHKKKAIFVPGEGYQVEGYEGYFDDQGRPIAAQVSKVVTTDKEKSHGLLNDARIVESVDGLKSQFGLGQDQDAAHLAYTSGEEFFRKEEYHKAAGAFKESVQRATDSQLKQDAMYYRAESHFFANEYPDAIKGYEELLKEYPNSPHLDKSVRRMFAIARYWEKYHDYDPNWPVTPNLIDDKRPWFDTVGNAIKVYESIRLNDPTGPLADDAVMATAVSYYQRGRYADADYNFKLLREEYPRSEHQFQAHIRGLKCKLLIYQGPNYDGAPLDEAKKLVKQLKLQFAGKLSQEESAQLAEVEARLQQSLAERDLALAKYYDETEHFGSAKFYYAHVMREYPNTEASKVSKVRYEEIADEPDHPDSSVQWLLDMVPENAERKTLKQVPLLEELKNEQ